MAAGWEKTMSGAFAGKTVLVTGATSGIGAACTRLFAARGARVMLIGRDEDRGAHLVTEITQANGAAEFLAGDVRQSEFCDAAAKAAVNRFGSLDVLINSAGIWHAATALDTSDELWQAIIDTNVSGLFYMSRAALRFMRPAGQGNIINIASDWGLVGGCEAAAYCASKGAVVLLTKAMALDHAEDNIRINALCPTDTDTPMMHRDYAARGIDIEEGKQRSAAGNPMRRMATAEDVAESACFLASDAAGFITGVALPIDGGASAD